jgi:hypothetical protein
MFDCDVDANQSVTNSEREACGTTNADRTVPGQHPVTFEVELPVLIGAPVFVYLSAHRYPLLNFAVVSAIYVFVSFRLFILTNSLKEVAIPGTDTTLLWRNFIIMIVGGTIAYTAGAAFIWASGELLTGLVHL